MQFSPGMKPQTMTSAAEKIVYPTASGNTVGVGRGRKVLVVGVILSCILNPEGRGPGSEDGYSVQTVTEEHGRSEGPIFPAPRNCSKDKPNKSYSMINTQQGAHKLRKKMKDLLLRVGPENGQSTHKIHQKNAEAISIPACDKYNCTV